MRALPILVVLLAPVAHAQSWPDLHVGDAPQGGGAHDVALVIGVSDYVYLPKIAGASDNATAWQEWLLRSRQVPGERVVLLRDREATREKIERNLKALLAQVGADGTVWFIFVGHGAPAPSGEDGLLLGADTDADADSLSARGVRQQLVLDNLEASGARHAIALFDACFSGNTADGSEPLVAGLQATLPVRRGLAPSKTAVLASSETFAGPLPGAGKPAFSYLALGALRGWADTNGNREVSVEELYMFARGAIQQGFKSDSRLPSRRGPDLVLASHTVEVRPDIDALLAGQCPAGHVWDGTRCTRASSIQCPPGSTWGGSKCVATCPAGTAWNEGGCVATQVECPRGTLWDGRGCVDASPPPEVRIAARESTPVEAAPRAQIDVEQRPPTPRSGFGNGVLGGLSAFGGAAFVGAAASLLPSLLDDGNILICPSSCPGPDFDTFFLGLSVGIPVGGVLGAVSSSAALDGVDVGTVAAVTGGIGLVGGGATALATLTSRNDLTLPIVAGAVTLGGVVVGAGVTAAATTE